MIIGLIQEVCARIMRMPSSLILIAVVVVLATVAPPVSKAKNEEVPDSGNSGDVTVGENAGEIEVALLTAKALDDASGLIVDRITNACDNHDASKSKQILLYAAEQIPEFGAYHAFNTELHVVDLALSHAIEQADKIISKLLIDKLREDKKLFPIRQCNSRRIGSKFIQ